MNIPFIQTRRERWVRLQQLLKKAEGSRLTSFTKEELIEFSVLYRQACTDLSLAQSQGLPGEIIEFINDLVTRSYHYVYRSEKTTWRQLRSLIFNEFPVLFRQNTPVILFAIGLLIIGWLAGFFGYLTGPQVVKELLPKDLTNKIIKGYEQKTWFNEPLVARPFISSFIMYNNIMVAIQAFGGGMLLGTLTCWALLYNGFILGALSAVFFQKGYFLSFWAMILPHGVIELTAIGLSAAAGLLLTKAIILPGKFSRQDSLKIHGTEAIKMIVGTIIMLVIAGLIEGFFSTIPTKNIPEYARLIFAALTAVLLVWYFTRKVTGNREQGTV